MSGETPLMAAAGYGHLEIVRLLVELGDDTALKSDSGEAALDAAVVWQSEDVAEYLGNW